mgnify:CR=1 FL=1|jgi:hypothetical protein
MIVTCDTCPAQGQRCDDCVVTVLATIAVGHPNGRRLDAAERRAVGFFVAAGLVDGRYAATLTATVHPRTAGQAVG